MADVGTEWQGSSMEYEVTMEEHYAFSWKESTGVPPMGEASLVLPPYTASTGLQPSEPNPYLGTRDASYTCGSAEHQACDMAGVFRDGFGEKLSMEDAFSPEEGHLYRP